MQTGPIDAAPPKILNNFSFFSEPAIGTSIALLSASQRRLPPAGVLTPKLAEAQEYREATLCGVLLARSS